MSNKILQITNINFFFFFCPISSRLLNIVVDQQRNTSYIERVSGIFSHPHTKGTKMDIVQHGVPEVGVGRRPETIKLCCALLPDGKLDIGNR